MTVLSAGILLYRGDSGRGDSGRGDPTISDPGTLEVFIAHMGGPFWARKDARAWSIPKGLVDDGEDPFAAARREFAEEIGTPAPDLPYELLGDFTQRSGKIVRAYFARSDFQLSTLVSNTFTIEWPRGSGTQREFAEIDDARWVPFEQARAKLVAGQEPLLLELRARLQR